LKLAAGLKIARNRWNFIQKNNCYEMFEIGDFIDENEKSNLSRYGIFF
jgi:hypothetical protein